MNREYKEKKKIEILVSYSASCVIEKIEKQGYWNQGVKCENDMKLKRWYKTYKKKTIRSPPPKYSKGWKQTKKIQGVKCENDIKI